MEFVEVSRDGPVALVRLNRPPVNALSEQLARELDEAFTQCEDPDIRAVVVTGKPHFAAGADIKGFKETFDSGGRETSASTLLDAISRLDSLAKPTIAFTLLASTNAGTCASIALASTLPVPASLTAACVAAAASPPPRAWA